MLKYVVAIAAVSVAPAFAGETVQQTMTLAECVQSVQQAQTTLATPVTTTVDTADRKEMVLTVPDGQITVSCDGPNNLATMTHN
ncbi:MAG TPA: hypothetical protein VFQ27_09965 [Xanthobacteraceae bacterium]|nr:hypothetical protein [Xanthobacteraceae bacterium]